jgi:hypothetical protein
LNRGKIGKRNKKASKKFRDEFGHTPVSIEEEIPWKCRRLVVGTGTHRGLPVMKEVKNRSKAPQIQLLMLPTPQAIKALEKDADQTNALLHVTC